MKLFSCTNRECKSHTPYDGVTNRVLQRITSDHPLNKNGMVNPDADTKIHNTEYICGRCGEKVNEVPLRRVMKIKIQKITEDKVFGRFFNKLRKQAFDFEIDKVRKKLKVHGLQPLKVEADFILEKYKEQYVSSIEAEVVDFDGKDKYEVRVFNPNEVESEITIVVEKGIAIDYYGDREPYDSEKNKAELAVTNSPYKGA